MAYPVELKSGGVILTNDTNINADMASDIIDIQRAKHVGLDCTVNTVDNSLVGVLEIQVCNDLTVASPNWVAVELSTGSTNVSLNASTNVADFYDLSDVAAKYLRVFFDYTSGYGNGRIVAHCKNV